MKTTLLPFFSILFALQFSIFFLNAQPDSTQSQMNGFVKVSANAFFDNLEFFNNIQKGYTLIGYNLCPHAGYRFAQGSEVSAGFHMLQFAGQTQTYKLIPTVTLSARLTQWFTVVAGTLVPNGRENLPEPLFKPERVLTQLPETGLQLIVETRPISFETWINWENMIFPNDTLQEEFTVGLYGKLMVSSAGASAYIPFYAIAVHHGGQINSTDEPVSTLANLGTGINLSLSSGGKVFGTESLVFLGRDASPNPHHPYKKGWALYPKLYYCTGSLKITAGYWHARQMILPRGEEVFGSLSLVNASFNKPQRHIATAELNFSKFVVSGLRFTAFFKLYYDLDDKLADYRFGTVMVFNHKHSVKNKLN